MTEQQQPQQQQIQVKAPDAILGGVYANNMLVLHTREEFILDFMMIAPPAGTITARVVCSPGHMKRIVGALQDNLKKYEDAFGKLAPAAEPGGKIGF
jgi:hypothetical protein